MAEASPAKQFFDQICAGGYEFLQSLIGGEYPENEWLDYKEAKHTKMLFNPVPASPDGKRAFGDMKKWVVETHMKYISAFSNTMGGVLIWGISTERSEEGKLPTAESLVPNVKEFEKLLNRHTSAACDPPVNGIENRRFEAQDGTAGFVVTYTPMSPSRPHKSNVTHTYYQRVQDNVYPLTSAMLRSMFHPHGWPRFFFTWQITSQANEENPDEKNQRKVRLSLTLKNQGRATAKSVAFNVEVRGILAKCYYDTRIVQIARSHGDSRWTPIRASILEDLHPGETLTIGDLLTNPFWLPQMGQYSEGVRVTANVYAEHAPAQKLSIEMDLPTLEKALKGDKIEDSAWAEIVDYL